LPTLTPVPTNPPPQPTPINCGQPAIYRYEPEECRTGMTFNYPLYICWERTKTPPVVLPQQFVEGCWIDEDGITNATLVGEGQIGLFPKGTPYECILRDLEGHILRRNQQKGANYIGLLPNGEADAWRLGYLADQCPPPPAQPVPTQPPVLVCDAIEHKTEADLAAPFTVPTGQWWHVTLHIQDWPNNPQEWSLVLPPGYTGTVQPSAEVPDIWVYSDENKAKACGQRHVDLRIKEGHPHTWGDESIRKRAFGN
jgi:hypothetical protein